MSRARRGSPHPIAEAAGCAGLLNGPKILKTVGTPSSRRVGPTNRIAGWNTGAKQKVIPTSRPTSATASGVSDKSTPRASRRSADPHDDEAARLPCLTTRVPVPAAAMADMVEMLTEFDRSPPVPTTSTAGPGTSMRRACDSIASTKPVTSVAVSPLARMPMRNPAI